MPARAKRDDLGRVQLKAARLAEVGLDALLHFRQVRAAASQEDRVEIGRTEAGLSKHVVAREEGPAREVLADLIEHLTAERELLRADGTGVVDQRQAAAVGAPAGPSVELGEG